MVDPDMESLVFDLGSLNFRVGYSGDDEPRYVFPAIVGRYSSKKGGYYDPGMEGYRTYYGSDAEWRSGDHDITFPILLDETGENFNHDLEKLCYFSCWNELRLDPTDHPIFVSSLHHMSKNVFWRFSSIFFETLNVPAFSMSDSSVLDLYCFGKTTGLSFECGNGITQATPIFEGVPIHYAKTVLIDRLTSHSDVSGSFLTDALFDTLSEKRIKKYDKKEYNDRVFVRNMKEKLFHIKLDDDKNDERHEVSYTLPDGTNLELESCREMFHQIPELLFNPSCSPLTNSSNLVGVHKLIEIAIHKTNPELHDLMFENIVVSGGTTQMKNFRERLHSELVVKCTQSRNRKVLINDFSEYNMEPYTKEQMNNLTWIGGSILSSLSTWQNQWITKEDYDDKGPDLIAVKCPSVTSTIVNPNCLEEDFQKYVLMNRKFVDFDMAERIQFLKEQDSDFGQLYFDEKKVFSILLRGSDRVVSVQFKSFLIK